MHVHADSITTANLDVICERTRIQTYGALLYHDVTSDRKNDVKRFFCFLISDLTEESYHGEVGVTVKTKSIS